MSQTSICFDLLKDELLEDEEFKAVYDRLKPRM